MKHFLKKLSALAASSAMVLGTGMTAVFAYDAAPPEPTEWEVSKSKTATPLDADYESEVTLSLPSAEEQLVTDVVFVLDKSTSAEIKSQTLDMLESLKAQVDKTDAKVKVGVVIFNKVANVTDFMDLTTQYKKIEDTITQSISSGTNTHAGLLAGKKMLDEDTTVDESRKYLIFVSDGITYMYNESPTVTAWSFNMPHAENDWHGKGSWDSWAGPDNWYSKYHTLNGAEDWSDWLEETGKQITVQGTEYEYPFEGEIVKATPEDIDNWDTAYAMSIDKALYLTWETYTACEAEGYNCYAMTAESNAGKEQLWGPSFMNYLAGDKEVSFEEIQNDIVYAIDSSSVVVDEIGAGTDSEGNPYEFEFIEGSLKLTVGGKECDVTEIRENTYGFKADGNGGYDYVVTYDAPKNDEIDGDAGKLTWHINVPVTNLEKVQLSYRVRLVNPQSSAGEYTGLSTNESAVIYPVDSQGNPHGEDAFENPEVSYTLIGTDITKVWEDEENAYNTRPEAIRVNLYADDELLLSNVLSERNDWTWNVDGLRVYSDYEGGKTITYTIEEAEVDEDYTSVITGDMDEGFVITNTMKTRPETPVTPDKPEEPKTPEKEVPDTSDSSNVLGFAGMTLIALGAACAVLVTKKRHA